MANPNQQQTQLQPQQNNQQQQQLTPTQKAQSIRAYMEQPAIMAMLSRVMDDPAKKDRFISIAMTAITKNPLLLDCDKKSLLTTVLTATQLNLSLDPNLGEAYVVPYWNKSRKCFDAQFQTGYKGIMKLARNSGVSYIDARCVYAGDHYKYFEGSEGTIIEHTPVPRSSRKKTEGGEDIFVAAYARAKLKDGNTLAVWLWAEDIDDRKNRSQSVQSQAKKREKGDWAADTPWDTDTEAMRLKSAIRALSKYLPQSPEQALAEAAEVAGERGRMFRPVDPSGMPVLFDAEDRTRYLSEAEEDNPEPEKSLEEQVGLKKEPPQEQKSAPRKGKAAPAEGKTSPGTAPAKQEAKKTAPEEQNQEGQQQDKDLGPDLAKADQTPQQRLYDLLAQICHGDVGEMSAYLTMVAQTNLSAEKIEKLSDRDCEQLYDAVELQYQADLKFSGQEGGGR